MHWMFLPLRRYFEISGRSQRREFWLFFIALWALNALDCGGYEIPDAQPGEEQTTREALIRLLLRERKADGGWCFSGDASDADMTAMALTALAPYKPLFVAGTTGVLGYGFYLVYWKPRRACAEDAACARPIPSRIVQIALWFATVLVAAAFAFDYVAPLLLSA